MPRRRFEEMWTLSREHAVWKWLAHYPEVFDQPDRIRKLQHEIYNARHTLLTRFRRARSHAAYARLRNAPHPILALTIDIPTAAWTLHELALQRLEQPFLLPGEELPGVNTPTEDLCETSSSPPPNASA